MKTFDPSAMEAAVTSIARRRATCGDDCEMLPADALGVLAYVLAHPGLPPDALCGDLGDALVIVRHLHGEAEHYERAFIRAARARGMTWEQIAGYLGYRSAQAAVQRAQRIGAAGKGTRRAGPEGALGWLEHNEGLILVTARTVCNASLPAGDAQEYAGWLREALAEQPPGLADVLANLGLVMDALQIGDGLRCLRGSVRRDALWLTSSWERMKPDAALTRSPA